jgi:pimeloyl-ACP methyl ester carboxylesterase
MNNKSLKRMLLILFSIVLGLLLILICILLLYSPDKSKPYLDDTGKPIPQSISEKIYVNINGMEQGMIIKSKDSLHPVLLYLHGGVPDYFLTQKYPTGLEDYFTVVWWERRGSGLSFNADISLKEITLEQLLSDTKEVTNYLRKRFGKEKIYLMGCSGGTFIGIQAAAQTPELYHAYIAVAQMTDQLKSERLAYEYMLEEFKKKGNKKMVRKLELAPITIAEGTPAAYDMKSIITGMFIPSFSCREYTLTEKINLWRAKAKSGVSILWDTILVTDLSKQVPEINIPIYFFHGIVAALLQHKWYKKYLFSIPLLLLGVAMLGVGFFPGNRDIYHGLFALLTFNMGGLMAITSFKIVSSPFSYLGILFGLITIITLYTASTFIPIIGDGGTERWVAYPVVLWLAGIGGYLLNEKQ